MAAKGSNKKNRSAVALGRKVGNKVGPARAAKPAPEQRSESARKAVQAGGANTVADTSDQAVLALLKRIKAANNATEIRRLSDQLERVIFHKQYESAQHG